MSTDLKGKKLLLLGGVQPARVIVTKAQELGVHVTVLDYNTDSPAKEIADEAVLIDAMDVDAIVDYCKKNDIDGVTTGFVDILMPICYAVCQRLGLPYYATPKMLTMATNKIEFKETCAKYGVPVPKTYVVGGEIPADIIDTITYPVFVKPLDASGSRGAGRCNNKEELIKQFAEALSYSKSGNAIIEDYITGTEFLLDYVGVDGEFRLLSMFDRYPSPGRGAAINYSNVTLGPAKHVDQYYREVNPKVINMFKELGFTDGLIFLQGYTDGERITFYEMGCRLGGSYNVFDQELLGVHPTEMTIRYALTGKMLDSIEKISPRSAEFPRYCMVANYLLTGDGETVARIDGVEDVMKLEDVVYMGQPRGVGYYIKKDGIVDKPIVQVQLIADTLDKMRENLAYMNEKIQVVNAEGKSLLVQKFDPNDLRR